MTLQNTAFWCSFNMAFTGGWSKSCNPCYICLEFHTHISWSCSLPRGAWFREMFKLLLIPFWHCMDHRYSESFQMYTLHTVDTFYCYPQLFLCFWELISCLHGSCYFEGCFVYWWSYGICIYLYVVDDFFKVLSSECLLYETQISWTHNLINLLVHRNKLIIIHLWIVLQLTFLIEPVYKSVIYISKPQGWFQWGYSYSNFL